MRAAPQELGLALRAACPRHREPQFRVASSRRNLSDGNASFWPIADMVLAKAQLLAKQKLASANSQLDRAKLERTLGLRLPAWQEGVGECLQRLGRGEQGSRPM